MAKLRIFSGDSHPFTDLPVVTELPAPRLPRQQRPRERRAMQRAAATAERAAAKEANREGGTAYQAASVTA